MADFKFSVFEAEDIEELSHEERVTLSRIAEQIIENRKVAGKTPIGAYLVINADEPYADEVVEIMKQHGHFEMGPAGGFGQMFERYKKIIEAADPAMRAIRAIGLINAVKVDRELDDHQKLDRIDTIVNVYNEVRGKLDIWMMPDEYRRS